MIERKIKAANFPTIKSIDSFEFLAIPSLNKMLVLVLACCNYISRYENIIAVGNSGTGKTHIALALGLEACRKGKSVGFITASALVHELLEARDEKRLLKLQKQLAHFNLPFDEWTTVFGSERLTGALLERLTHHVHILELNGDSYRLAAAKKARQSHASEMLQPQ